MGGSPGKLKAAARWLLDEDPTSTAAVDEDPESAQLLMDIGVPAHQVVELTAKGTAEVLEVWAWHRAAVELFKGMRSQWLTATVGMGQLIYLGLNYVALPIVEQRLGVACDAATFEALQTMEREGARCFNKGL